MRGVACASEKPIVTVVRTLALARSVVRSVSVCRNSEDEVKYLDSIVAKFHGLSANFLAGCHLAVT